MNNIGVGGEQCVHCREVVHSSECPLSEVPLYTCDAENTLLVCATYESRTCCGV